MRNILTVLFLSLSLIGNSSAETILQALKEAYNSNVELNAERENLIVSEQDLKIIRSESSKCHYYNFKKSRGYK